MLRHVLVGAGMCMTSFNWYCILPGLQRDSQPSRFQFTGSANTAFGGLLRRVLILLVSEINDSKSCVTYYRTDTSPQLNVL